MSEPGEFTYRRTHRAGRELLLSLLAVVPSFGIAAVPRPSPDVAASLRTSGIAAAAAEVQRSEAPGEDRLLDSCWGGPPVGVDRSVIGCCVSHATFGSSGGGFWPGGDWGCSPWSGDSD